MLKLQNIELYTKLLIPPDGYETHSAVCLTYSLDLTMLLAACLSLFSKAEFEGRKAADRLDLAASLGNVEGRLRVFAQAGHLKVPQQFSSIHHLIEPCIRTIAPEQGSFHPKVWLIRYQQREGHDQGSPVFRLVVLSRNLTDSHHWDVVFHADGSLEQSALNSTETSDGGAIEQFFRTLPLARASGQQKQDTISFVDRLLEGIRHVRFDTPAGITSWEFIGLTPENNDSVIPADAKRLAIISPFLTEAITRHWADSASPSDCYLFSRQDALDRVFKNGPKGYQHCFVVRDEVIDAEYGNDLDAIGSESSTEKHFHDIHAKVYLWETEADQSAGRAHALVGSANCTHSAFRNNFEAMVRLNFERSPFSDLVQNLCGMPPNGEPGSSGFYPFVPYVASTASETDTEAEHLTRLRRFIAKEVQSGRVFATGNSFTLEIDTPELNHGLDAANTQDFRVEINLLTRHNADVPKVILPEVRTLQFTKLSAYDVTAFLIVSIASVHGATDRQSFLLRVTLDCDEAVLQQRERQAYRTMLQSMSQFLNYLALALGDTPTAATETLLGPGAGTRGRRGGTATNSGLGSTPLYERLLRTMSREPGRLQEVDRVVHSLEAEDGASAGPNEEKPLAHAAEFKEFITFWEPFRKMLDSLGREQR